MGKAAGCWGILLALLLCFAKGAVGQEVRRESGDGITRTRFNRAAEKQGRSDWPQPPYDGSGTQVRITFDARNADVTLMVPRNYGPDRLLSDARQIVPQLQLPRADFVTWEGTSTASVDMEFNKYLLIHEGDTDFELDLSALANALRQSSLPTPIVIGVDTEDATRVRLQTGKHMQTLDGFWFIGVNEVQPDTHLGFHLHISWYAYPLVIVLGGMILLLPVGLPWVLSRSFIKSRRRLLEVPQEAEKIPDPEEVQRRYDKSRPQWLFLLPFLLPTLLLLLGNPRPILSAVFQLMPIPAHYVILWMPGVFLLSSLLCFGVTKLCLRSLPMPERKEDPSVGIQRRAMLLPFLVMGGIMVVIMLFMTLRILIPPTTPGWRTFQIYFGRTLMWGAPFIILLFPISAYFSSRKLRTTLMEGPWYEMVQELAAKARVRVKNVVLIQSTTPNAYASVLGTVGLTSKLLEVMEPEEIRPIVAHELGHLRCGHPRRILIMSLALFAILLIGWNLFRAWGAQHLPDHVNVAFNNPLLFLLLINVVLALVIGPGRRRREEEADRFAVEWTGDPELVIRSLVHLHTVSGTPFRLKPSDEALSTHPSLQHRIEAIRRYAVSREFYAS